MSGNGRLLTLFDELASQTVLLMRTALADARVARAGRRPSSSTGTSRTGSAARDVAGCDRAVGAHYQYTQDRLFAVDPALASSPEPEPGAEGRPDRSPGEPSARVAAPRPPAGARP